MNEINNNGIPADVSVCHNCGNTIYSSAKFCSYCGAVAVNEPAPITAADVAGQNLAMLSDLIAYFAQAQHIFDEYDKTLEKIKDLRDTVKIPMLVWGIITSVFSLYFLLGAVSSIMDDIQVFAILMGIFLFISSGGVFMILFFALLKKKRNAELEKNRRYYFQLFDQLTEIYRGYPNCPVALQFINPYCLAEICATIESARANTVGEALPLLYTMARRNRREDLGLKTAQYLLGDYYSGMPVPHILKGDYFKFSAI